LKLTYYPGCTAHSTGRELDESLRDMCKSLEVELVDLEDWNCCGSSSAHVLDPFLATALPARNLELAEKQGNDVVVACSACFNRMRSALKHAKDGDLPEGSPQPKGSVDVLNLVDLMATDQMLTKIEQAAGAKLKGVKIAAYYGCLSLRPGDITDVEKVENPDAMEKVIEALGGEALDWPYKTQCCGASMAVSNADIVYNLSDQLFDMAMRYGAEAFVTGCPMCLMNLERTGLDREARGLKAIPIYYITELVMLTLDKTKVEGYLRRHLMDARQFLAERGLL
jgi:heterodisulfide reductase subunit B2